MKHTIQRGISWLLILILSAVPAGVPSALASEEPPMIYGDTNYDLIVGAGDAAIILQHTVGLLYLRGDIFQYADVSGDGLLNAADALLILQYVVRLIDRFPAEDPDPNPDEPDPDEPSPDDPNPDNPNPDEPNPDEPNPDEPNPDDPNPDDPNPDEPDPDEPTPDDPNPDNPNPDEPNPDEPEPDEPVPGPTATLYFTSSIGTAVEPITAEVGSAIQPPPAPTHPKYRFLEWLLDGEPYEFTTMPEQDVTLTARWEGQRKLTFRTGTAEVKDVVIYAFPGQELQPLLPQVQRQGQVLSSWIYQGQRLSLTQVPDADAEFSAHWVQQTNLPALIIELRDGNGKVYPLENIDRENYVSASYTVTNMPGQEDIIRAPGQFRGRGNGSWAAQKKGYRVKFEEDQPLFGLPADKDWVLISCTNGYDETLSRNHLAFSMGAALFDGIEYCTTPFWVDMYVNGNYHGVYLLTERVEVEEGRVNVLSDGIEEDAGFLLEYDRYAEGTEGIDYFSVTANVKYPFTVHYPEFDDFITEGGTQQEYRKNIAYIQDYVDRVYTAALAHDFETFCELADLDSFVDMYLLQELCKNADAGWSSFFLYKKPGGKLYLGPPWDFDGTASISGRGDAGSSGIYVADTINKDSPHTASELFRELYRTPEFYRAVQIRWAKLAPKVKEYVANYFSDTLYNEYRAAIARNFVLWNGRTQQEAEERWIKECNTLRSWFLTRTTWLTRNWGIVT